MVRFRPGEPKRRLAGQLVWFALWAATTAFAVFLTPAKQGHGTHTQLGLPPCPSAAFFDRPCPGCGLTTSFTAMVHGDFVTAFQANAFGPVFYLLFTASALVCIYGWMKGLYLDTNTRAFNLATMSLLIGFVAFGAVRFATVKFDSDLYKVTSQARSVGEQGR
jgi:hypothetical protein